MLTSSWHVGVRFFCPAPNLCVRCLSTAPKAARNIPSIGTKPQIPGVKQVVAVASGKGGVGKSTTAVNLAVGLSKLPERLRVGLLDADIYGPSIPLLMNLDAKPQVGPDKKLIPLQNYGIRCMSMGFLVPKDSPMIWRGPMVMSAVQQLFFQVDWSDTDVLVVDLPPGTGDAQLTISQQVPVSGAVIVSTPQDIALLDAVRGTNMFRKVNVPILGLIENMSFFQCPNCQHTTHIFGHEGARQTASRLGLDFLGEVPLHVDVRSLSDAGQPITFLQPEGPFGLIYREIAARVWAKLNDPAMQESVKGPSIVVE